MTENSGKPGIGGPVREDFDVFHNAHWVSFPRWLGGEHAFVWDGRDRLIEWDTEGGGKYVADAVVTGVKSVEDCKRVLKAYYVGLGDGGDGACVEVRKVGFAYRNLIR